MKWYIVLEDEFDTAVFVKGFDDKVTALESLSKWLEEEPEFVTYYTIRKQEDMTPLKVKW